MSFLFSLSFQLVTSKCDIIAYIITFVMYICVLENHLTSTFGVEKHLNLKVLDLLGFFKSARRAGQSNRG